MATYKQFRYPTQSGQEHKLSIKALSNDAGTLEIIAEDIGNKSNLTTTEKNSLVGAINEVNATLDAHTEEDATDAHTIGNITGLTTALSNKASTTHDHDDAYAPQFSAITSLSTSTTLALSHAQKLLRCTSSSNRTITVPPNSSVEFPVGTEIEIVQFGTGTVTIAAGSNVTIRSKDSKLAIDGQYAGATLKKIDTNEWLLIGALK